MASRRAVTVSAVVVDASVACVWLFDDENDPRAYAVLEYVEAHGGFVPQFWFLELYNAALAAERRGRDVGDPVSVERRLRSLSELPIRTDPSPDLQFALTLARRHRLSMYDAIYLELAIRRNCGLATLDAALRRAAEAESLPLVE